MKELATTQPLQLPALIESKTPDVAAIIPPNTLDAARLVTGFKQAFNNKPELRECSHVSIVAALLNSASLGIIPETPEKHAYLIPRKPNRDATQKACELEISYRGFVHLIIRGDRRRVVKSDVVHEGDTFEFENGTNIVCRHVPNLTDPDRHSKPVIAAWALVEYPDGQKKLEVMDRGALAKIENAMLRQNFGKITPAWKEWRTEMLRKAPLKRLAKTSDLGPEVAKAAELDNSSFARPLSEDRPMILPSGRTIEAAAEVETVPADEPEIKW